LEKRTVIKHAKLQNVYLTQTIYRFLLKYFEQHRACPSYQEIAQGCYMAPSTISRHLDRLEMAGVIERVEGQKRNIRLTDQPLPKWLHDSTS
jgi:DNA-binding MarR family transcriptional regulator